MINIRRGDLIALVSAVLVFIFSFLAQVPGFGGNQNLWHKFALLYVFTGPILALIVAALILLPILGNAVPTPLGIDPHRWTLIGSFLVAFTGVIWMIAISDTDAKYGAVLMMIFGLVLLAAAVATEYVAELRVPLAIPKPGGAPASSGTSAPVHDHSSHEGHDHP